MKKTRLRAEMLVAAGFGVADAAHVAFSEAVGANFVSCDDRLLKKCWRKSLDIWCGDPLQYCQAEDMALIEFEFPSLYLGRGSYILTVALHSRDTHLTANYDWWDRAMVFQVVPDDSSLSIGVGNMPVQVRWREV